MFERVDSGYAFRTAGRFHYGETTPVPGGTFVSKRAWEVMLGLEGRPHRAFAPYVLSTLGASLENRIERRYSLGGGARYNAVKTTATEVILSAGAVGENTVPLASPTGTDESVTLARATTALRLRRDLSSSVTVSSETTYQPALTANDYTVVSLNTLKTRLARFAALTLSFRDSYDNRAVFRGARVNNDGELLIGLLTTF